MHLGIVGLIDLEVDLVVANLHDRPDDPSDRAYAVILLERLHHLALLLLLLAGPAEQDEIHDDKEQNQEEHVHRGEGRPRLVRSGYI